MRPVAPSHPLAVAIRRLRNERGITQEGLAFDADVTIGTLSRIERGLSSPALATVAKIADALDMPLPELVREVVGELIDGEEVRRDLEAYAQAHVDRDVDGIAELVGVIDRARAVGLDVDTIAVLVCGGRAA